MGKIKVYAIQGAFATVTASFTAKLGILWWVFLIFALCIIVDFLSGMAASKKESIEHPEDKNKGWNSKKGLLGIIKKFGYILIVGVAFILDFLIYKTSGYLGIEMPTSTFFCLLISVLFILNELLSITENAGRMGANIPQFLVNAISVLKGKVENKADSTDRRSDKDGI
jgi:toxin secretion/phage lysis holin